MLVLGTRQTAELPPRPGPGPGYHHLGATSVGTYGGVLGRLTVTDPGVRQGTFDFVAARFMAKADAGGATHWLEAGWAETGWAGGGKQRIYTFDTVRDSWTFHDGYPVKPGDRIWIYVEVGQDTTAWLWWGDGWHLLTTVALPFGGGAQVEQYVEVYVDPARGGTVPLPRTAVDNVQVKTPAGLRYWRDGDVPTAASPGGDGYCLGWQVAYDTWSAGDCTT